MIDREAFEEWKANPITEHVLQRVGEIAEENKQLWMAESWGSGNCDIKVLIELKARAQAAHDLSTIRYEDVSDDADGSGPDGNSKAGTE